MFWGPPYGFCLGKVDAVMGAGEAEEIKSYNFKQEPS